MRVARLNSSDESSRKNIWQRLPKWVLVGVPGGLIISGLLLWLYGPLLFLFLGFWFDERNSGWSYFMADLSQEQTAKRIDFAGQTVKFILSDYEGASGDINVQVWINGNLEQVFPSFHDKDFLQDFPAVEYGVRKDISGDWEEDLVFQIRSGVYYVSSQSGQLVTIKEPI